MNLFNRFFGHKPKAPVVKPKPVAPISAPTKLCPRCSKTLSVSLFGKNRTKKDGLQAWCNSCTYAAQKQCKKKQEKTVVVKQKKALSIRFARINPNAKYKATVTVTVQDVERAKYEKLVAIAQKQNVNMNQLYQKMINDFLTLNS